jgi:2-hydroxy-3-keto-5-methylthiopentenyl-1-phosphate phosphatase
MTRKEMIIKAKKISEELVELVDCRNVVLSEDNYKQLMKNLGFSDEEIYSMIASNSSDNYITPHKVYKHINNTDIAFYVLSVGFTDDKLLCDGYWLNVVNKPETINRDNIVIHNDDIQNWKEYIVNE